MKIAGTKSDQYTTWQIGRNVNNGAYWYAREIEEIILPELVNINLYINTVGAQLYHARELPKGAVIVCHDNVTTRKTYMKYFGMGVLWICSKQSVVDYFTVWGEKAVLIPLSVDTEYVSKFKRKRKTKDTAFVGNAWSFKQKYLESLPEDIDQLHSMARDDLLKEMAKYKNVIAEGRCLIEAKVLGCNYELPKHGYGDTVDREVIDSRETIPLWRDTLEQHALSLDYCILECMVTFNDLQQNRVRRIGEYISVSRDRAKELLSNEHRIVEMI